LGTVRSGRSTSPRHCHVRLARYRGRQTRSALSRAGRY
jgi:hypothetical protein